MLNIIADGKQYKLSDGQIIIVKKIILRDYYLLISSLLIYKKALGQLIDLTKFSNIKEYLNNTRAHAYDIAKTKVEFDNIKLYLKEMITGIDLDKQEQKVIFEIMNCVLDFNSVKLGAGGKEFDDLEELNEELEIRIGIISAMLNITPESVMMLNNYDAGILIREHNRQRVSMINDIRLAYHGDKTNYIKYTRGLMGEKVYTGDEIFQNPSILKQEVH